MPYPDWNGEFNADATLVISGEQGAGDEILFAAFLPGLLEHAHAAGMQVIIVCQPRLLRLFRANFTGARVLPGTVSQLPGRDVLEAQAGQRQSISHCPIGDLPRWCSKPTAQAYLRPDPDDLVAARQALACHPLARDCRRIGLVWSANPFSVESNRQERSVPSRAINESLCDLEGVHFYSLMPPEHGAALADVADVAITDMSMFVTDFSRTAALMCCLDEVVSVCTSSANLAGALGCTTHVLLKRHADWRWYDNTSWYPRTQTYRQAMTADWHAPLQQLRECLRASGRTAS